MKYEFIDKNLKIRPENGNILCWTEDRLSEKHYTPESVNFPIEDIKKIEFRELGCIITTTSCFTVTGDSIYRITETKNNRLTKKFEVEIEYDNPYPGCEKEGLIWLNKDNFALIIRDELKNSNPKVVAKEIKP